MAVCVTVAVIFPQDNYTFAQPGIQMKVRMLEELVGRIDGERSRGLCRGRAGRWLWVLGLCPPAGGRRLLAQPAPY